VLSQFLHRYSECYPNVQVKLIEAPGLEIHAMLVRGQVHLGQNLLYAVPPGNERFASQSLEYVHILAVCQVGLQLGAGGKIDIKRLAPYPLLLMDTQFAVRGAGKSARRRHQYRYRSGRACAADGHTLLLVGPANTFNAALYENLNFNFIRDVAPIAGLMRVSNLLVVCIAASSRARVGAARTEEIYVAEAVAGEP
jgi:DNA-binding transcriptional LysR family regulator